MPVQIVSDRTDELLSAFERAVKNAISETAESIKERARRKVLDPPKTGAIYHSTTKPSPHQASAPGEAPANWTGNLVEAILTEPGEGISEVVYVDHDKAPYGADHLEFGTPGGKIAARPFFWNSVEEERQEFPGRVIAALQQVK